MNKNTYLIVDGERIELTKEQMEYLGIKVKEKTIFDRVELGEHFYTIDKDGCVDIYSWNGDNGFLCHQVANYCTDEKLLISKAKTEVLNRLLWRFSMENNGDKIDWNDEKQAKYRIYKDILSNDWRIVYNIDSYIFDTVYFISQEIAEKAIHEIVIPFMKGELDICTIWER